MNELYPSSHPRTIRLFARKDWHLAVRALPHTFSSGTYSSNQSPTIARRVPLLGPNTLSPTLETDMTLVDKGAQSLNTTFFATVN